MAAALYQITTSNWISSSDTSKKSNITLALQIYPSVNTAKVDWSLRLNTGYGKIVVGELKVTFGEEVIYYRSAEQKKEASNNEIIASGSTTIELDGSSTPLDVYVGAGIYEWAINVSARQTINLSSNRQLASVEVSTATVGEETKLIINDLYGWIDYGNQYGLVQCATLRYKFGNFEGIIVENTTNSSFITWLVPTEIFNYYPTQTSATGTIYCDSYSLDGKTLYGTTQKSIIVYLKEGPSLSPTVEDIDPITLALTGDKNVLVRFFSNAKYTFNATPGTGTSLHKYYLECADQKITKYSTDTQPDTGTIEDVESGTFVFSVTDRRNYTSSKTVNKDFLEYKKLTCNIWRKSATADGTIEVGIKGDYWAHWFGVKHNTLKISYRYKAGNGEFSEWQSFEYLTDTDDYEATITLRDLDYQTTYTFEAMAQDELMTVVSRQLPVHCLPIYDWGRDDFNVNVNFKMNNQTVLRHNHTANNLVVSSSGGFIYFRPLGTSDTSAEVKISPQGNIELAGDIIIEGQSLKSLLGI